MKRIFRIPKHLEENKRDLVCGVINLIPNNWSVLRAKLVAPHKMITLKRAVASTKLVFGSSQHQIIVPSKSGEIADFLGVLFHGKRTEEVDFGHNFGYCEVMPIRQSKIITTILIQEGYHGRLKFEYEEQLDIREPPNFSCEIHIPHIGSGNDMSVRFTIESNNEDGYNPTTTEPIIAFCEKEKLNELKRI